MPAVIRSPRRVLATASLLTAVAGSGGACVSTGDDSSTPTVTPTATVADLAEVSAEEFSMAEFHHPDLYGFRYSTGRDAVGECVSDGESATCTGVLDPDATDGHLPVAVEAAGVRYSSLEGVPPTPRQLDTGETVTIGDVTCAAPDAETMSCTTEGASLTVTGPDRRIVTTGPWLDE